MTRFSLDCGKFKQNFLSLWSNLNFKVSNCDGVDICQFIDNLDQHHKVLLLLGSLHLSFKNVTNTIIKRLITQAAAVGKIYEENVVTWSEDTMDDKKATPVYI